jgi:hypothetical protein
MTNNVIIIIIFLSEFFSSFSLNTLNYSDVMRQKPKDVSTTSTRSLSLLFCASFFLVMCLSHCDVSFIYK